MTAVILTMKTPTPTYDPYGDVLQALDEAANDAQCLVSFESVHELARLWRIGIGLDVAPAAQVNGRLVRFLPADAEPLVIAYPREGQSTRLVVSRDALQRIRTHADATIGEQLAAAIRMSATLLHEGLGPEGEQGGSVPACLLAVGRPASPASANGYPDASGASAVEILVASSPAPGEEV